MKSVRQKVKRKWKVSDKRWKENEKCQTKGEKKMKSVRQKVKRKWKVSDKRWKENENASLCPITFFLNRAVYEIMWKNNV